MGGLSSGPGPGIFLLITIVFILAQNASSAPLYEDDENDDGSSQAISQSHGCYYNFRYYNEGERIITNEPCLNCTCRNRMFMCYLRVCPFTKGIGQNCTIEKVPGQCCPIITCPEVPVHLLTSSSTTELSQGSKETEINQENAIGHFEGNGCQIEGIFYPNGAQVPSSSEKPCELCYCIRNKTSCIMQTCALHVDGCRPIYEEGQCFPVRYQCDESAYQEPEPTTTYRPPPATGLLFTTTSSEALECTHNNDIYEDGARIQTDDPCEHCYCLKGKIACAIQECGIPLEKEGQNCTALPAPPGKCCPDSYQCDVTMTSPDVNLSTDGPFYTIKPAFESFEGSTEGITSNQEKKHPLKNEDPEANLKPHTTDKETQNSVPNENLSDIFPNNLYTKPILTTKNYDKIENHSDLEKITEKYQTPQDSLTGQSNEELITQHQTPSFESGNVSLKPINGSKEDLVNKNSIKETQLTQENESPPGLIQTFNVVSEKLPVLKDRNPQQQITSSETEVLDDHKQTSKPEFSHEINQPSKVNAGHDMTIETEKISKPSTESASQSNDDTLLNKLHNIIQDVQAQVNEGKTTSIPEEADYGITLSNQKGHFTDKPESLIHTLQTNQDTQLFYDDGQTGKPTENYGYSESEGTQSNNEIFNKLPGFIHDIYQQITSTLTPLKQQETSSTSIKDESLVSSDGHSVKQPSSVYKIPHLSNEETSKYPYQPDLKEQTTEYQVAATQDVLTDKDISPSHIKPINFYSTPNSIKINSTETNKKPAYENVGLTSDTTTVEIVTDATKTTISHHYLPSENINKEFDKLTNNKTISIPVDLENMVYSTTYSFEEATDVPFELNTKKNLSVPNSGESDSSFNKIIGGTTKYDQKKKPIYSEGTEHLDAAKVTFKPGDSTGESFLSNLESQKYSTDYPNNAATEIQDNFNTRPSSQKRKPVKPFGQIPEIDHTGEKDPIEDPDSSTPFIHFPEIEAVNNESVTVKPNSHKPVTKYPFIESTQNSEDFTKKFVPTHSEEHFPHIENSVAHIEGKPEIGTTGYVKPEHFPHKTEVVEENFTSRPHDYYSTENNLQESSKPLQDTYNKDTSTLGSDNKIHSAHKPVPAENSGIIFDRHDPTRYSNVPASTSETDHFNKGSTTPAVTQKHPLHNAGYFGNPNERDPITKYPYDESTIDSVEYTENLQENSYITTEYIKDLIGQLQGQTTKKPLAVESYNPNKTWEPTALNQETHVINPTKLNEHDTKNSGAEPFINRPNESNVPELEKEIEDVFTNEPDLIDVTQYTTSGYKGEVSKPENLSENFGALPSINIEQQQSQKYSPFNHQTTIKPALPSKSPYDSSTLFSEDHSTQSEPNTENLNVVTSTKPPSEIDQLAQAKPVKPEWVYEQFYSQNKRPWLRPEETEKTESLEKYEITEIPGVPIQTVQHFDQHSDKKTDKPDVSDGYPLTSEHRPGANLQQTETSTSFTHKEPGFHIIRPSSEPVENEISSTDESNLKPEQHDIFLLNHNKPTKNTTELSEETFGDKVTISTEHIGTEEIFENIKEITTLSNNFFQDVKDPNQTGTTTITNILTEFSPQSETDLHKKVQNQYKPSISLQTTGICDSQKGTQTDKTIGNIFYTEQTTYASSSDSEGSTININEEMSSTQTNEFHTLVPPVQVTNLPNSELYPSKKRPVKPSLTPTDIKTIEGHQTTDPEKQQFLIDESHKIFKQPHNETGINPTQETDLGHTNQLATQNYVTDYEDQKTTEKPDDELAGLSYQKEKTEKPFVKPQGTNHFSEDYFEGLEKSTVSLNLFSENDAFTSVTQKKYKPLSTTEIAFKKTSDAFYQTSGNTDPAKTETRMPQETTEYLFTSDHKDAEHVIFQTTEHVKEYFTDYTETPSMLVDSIDKQEKQPSSSQGDTLKDSIYLTTVSINKATGEDSQPEINRVAINKPVNETVNFDTSSTSIPSSLEQVTSNTRNQEKIVSEKAGEKFTTRHPEDSGNKHSSNIHLNLDYEHSGNENQDHSEKPYFTTNEYEETSNDPIKQPYLPPEPSHASSLSSDNKLTTSVEHFEPPFLSSSTYDPNKLSGDENKNSHHSFDQGKENFKEPLTDKTTSDLIFTQGDLESSTHKSESFLTEDPERISTTKWKNKEVLTEVQSTGNSPESEDLIDDITHPSASQGLFGITEPSRESDLKSSTQKHSSSFYDSALSEFTISTERFQHNKIQGSLTSNHFETSNDPVPSTYLPEESSTKITDTKPLKFSTPKLDIHSEEISPEELSEKNTTQPSFPHLESGTSGLMNFPRLTSQQPDSTNDDSAPTTTTDSPNAKFTSSDLPLKFPIDDSTDLNANLFDVQTRLPSIYENSQEKVSTNKIEISSTKPDEQNILSTSDKLEQITADTPKHSSSSIQFSTPIYDSKPDTHVQEAANQEIPEVSSTANFDTSSISKLATEPDSILYTTTHPDKIMTTTFKSYSNQDFENSFTEKNYPYFPVKIPDGDDLINKLHDIIQEIQTQKADDSILKSTSKIPDTDFFTVDFETSSKTTTEKIIYEGFTPLNTSYQKRPEIAAEHFTEKPDVTTGLDLEVLNQEFTNKYSVGTQETEIPETHRNITDDEFHLVVKPEGFTTEGSSNIKEDIISTTSHKGVLITDTILVDNVSSKFPHMKPLDSQFQDSEAHSVTEAEIFTSTKSFKNPETPTTYNIKEDSIYSEMQTFKPDNLNKFSEFDTEKQRPSNEENKKPEENQYFSEPSQSIQESTPQNLALENSSAHYSQQKPQTHLKPLDIFDQTMTTTSNPDTSAFTTKFSHTSQNYTSKETEHPPSIHAITNTTHLVGDLISTEIYKKTTAPSAVNLHETRYTVTSPTERPENKFSGIHFNKITPTDNGSSVNTIVVTPNVGSLGESLQYDTTTNPIHLVYPTYYPDGIIPYKPVNESPKDQNDTKLQTNNKTLEESSESSLDHISHTMKTTEIPEVESITEQKNAIYQTGYTSYEIQTEISSESITGRPVVIVEEIKTEVHSEKPTTKSSFILQENEGLENFNKTEHSTVDYLHEFSSNKISNPVNEDKESSTEKVHTTQFYPSKEQISSQFDGLNKKPESEKIKFPEKPNIFEDANTHAGTDYPFAQVTKILVQQPQQITKDDHIMHLYSPKDKYKKTTTTAYHHIDEKTQTESPKYTLLTDVNSFHEISTDSLVTINYPSEENEKSQGSTQILGSEFQVTKTNLSPNEQQQETVKTSSTIKHFTPQAPEITGRPSVIAQEFSEPNFTRFPVSETDTPSTENELLISGTTNKIKEQEFLIVETSTIPDHHILPERFSPSDPTKGVPSTDRTSFVPFKTVNGTKIYYPDKEQAQKPNESTDNNLYDGYDMLPYKTVNGSKVFYTDIVMSTDKPSSVSPVLGMYVPYKIINNTKVYFTEDQPDNKDYDGLDYVPFEIVDGKKIFHTAWVTPLTTTTPQSHIQGMYIPYKVINGSRVFFPEDAQDDSKNISDQYDGFQYIPHKMVNENNIQDSISSFPSPNFQALYVPFKISNNTKVYYPKDAEEKPLKNLKDYDGFDYVPFEIANGIKVFYPEKGIPSYLAANSTPYTTINAQNNYPQNYESNYVPNIATFPSKLTTEKLPSEFFESAMFVPFKMINGTKVFYAGEAQYNPHNIAEGYDGVEYVPYELKNGTKVFQPSLASSKPLQVIFVPYKIVNESKIFYPTDSSQKPIQSLPNKYDGIDYLFYENKNGTDVFYSNQNRPIEQPENKGMYLPYKIINGSKVFYPEDAKYHFQFIPKEYDGFEFIPHEVKNGTKVFYPTKTKETDKLHLNELHSNGMYVPYKMINNTKVYYVNEAQNRPHPLSDEYHGLDYLPYEVTNNTANISPEKFNKSEIVPMYIPFKVINGSKVHYPNDAQKEPQHPSKQYDGYDHLLFDNLQNNVVFHIQDSLTSTTSQPILKSALYVPYKISDGAKIFHPKDAQEKPELIPHGYDGFEYIPYEIIDGKKVFHPEAAMKPTTTAPAEYPHSLYVPFRIINGTKVYYPALAQNKPGQVPEGYEGFDYIPYEIVNGEKVFHPEQIKLSTSTPSTLGSYVPYKVINGTKVYYTNHAQEETGHVQGNFDGFDYLYYEIVDGKKIFKPQSALTPVTLKNALYVPFRINNRTKVFYPKDAQDEPHKIPYGYDGFEYIPYEIIDGKRVFRPEEATQPATKPTPFSEAMYIPYKIINGTKTYYPALAKFKPEKLQEGYDGVDFIPLEVLYKHKVNYPEENVKPSTTSENLVYIFVPYKWENGTKVFYPNEGKHRPQEIPQGYDGFEYLPYEVIEGKKVFYPELAVETPSQFLMPLLEGIFVPYKISNETKIFYPAYAQKNHQIPVGYDGMEYVPYENINGTKIFYPELISIPIPGASEVYVPYKMSNGKKIFHPEAASVEVPTNELRPLYDGIAFVSYKSHFQRPDKPFFGTNSEVIYVHDEEGLKPPKNPQDQNTNYSVPGEGSCLVNNITYNDNSEIPSFNPCQDKCKCINSIVRCVRIKCPSTSHGNKKNCSPIYKEDSCCPIYDCAEKAEQPTTVNHNHIFTEEIKQDSYLTTTEIIPNKPSSEAGNDLTKKPYEKDNQHVQKLPKPNPDAVDPYDNIEGLVSGETNPEDEYGDDDEPYGPGTCRYAGKIYVSAQQIPRDDPCDFCFCFRSDIICLQQSCPPPIPGCRDEPIHGFCCPRYECHVKMATVLNVTSTTTTTTTTLPPHFFSHAYKGSASRTGCLVQGKAYRVGQAIPSASGPCMDCICGGNGRMKCEPKVCAPEPLIRKMVVPTETTSSFLKRR